MPIHPIRSSGVPKFLVASCLGWALAANPLAAAGNHWVVTWGTSPAPQMEAGAEAGAPRLQFADQTIREIVRVSIGGGTVRVRLTNAYGKQAVGIGAAHIAVCAGSSVILAGSDRILTFGGKREVVIPPDAPVLSDPVPLDVPALGEVALSVFVPGAAAAAGIHYSARQTAYVGPGDLTAASSFPAAAGTIPCWVFLSGVDVLAPESASAVAVFGDSITDGSRSTQNANHRWPDFLAARLLARAGSPEVGVLNSGIGGNRLLHDPSVRVQFGVNALARFDRDVLAQPGVRYVVVLEGINDVGHPGAGAPLSETVTAEDVIAALKQLIARAHEHGLRIFGATLTPFEGTAIPGYFTPEKELRRKAVNAWIRTGGAFDATIDFDRAIRDPAHPDRMFPDYDGGDHLHPGDRGYEAMADAVDLSLFH